MDSGKKTGLGAGPSTTSETKLIQYINLKLASLGCPTFGTALDPELGELVSAFLSHNRESERLLANYLCPADQRIQDFIYDYLQDVIKPPKLPTRSFVLDREGLARVLSLPPDRDEFVSDIVKSYRVKQGVLHNPKSDRRTTKGIFHIAEGGLPVPDDKVSVPKGVFGNLLRLALRPPCELMRLPFTSSQDERAECFVSLQLRPIVCPEVPGFTPQKSMEIRFFVPGNLVSNLDFVETIFGNAGDPYLPENDAALDAEHWTGHTGCVILAPHLVRATKKELGLPHCDQATERQRRDGMCWKTEDECYNDGRAFKVTCRDETGVIVTVIADNYFGYCKKEVKTQISYSANLFGLCEEEHAGGALVYPSYDLGEEFSGSQHVPQLGHSFEEMVSQFGEIMDVKPQGYAIDKRYPDIVYVPHDAQFYLQKQSVTWVHDGATQSIRLLPKQTYVRPSGYKVHMEKPAGKRAWRLIGTVAEGTFCHKPCTVSGGGKSEISKPITDAIIQGPVFVSNFQKDFDAVAELLSHDYSKRFKKELPQSQDSRLILSSARSLGSVIKLLTPSPDEYIAEYNSWLKSIPHHIKELVFVIKRFYRAEWGDNWREQYSVDVINGTPGNELKFMGRKLVTNYLRVGFAEDGSWRVFGLRKDFQPAVKLAREDDISASVVVPAKAIGKEGDASLKFITNCEYRLFQRPDDAIQPGYDHQTEADFAQPGNFFSNYEPLTPAQARELIEDSIRFTEYTAPMQDLIQSVAERESGGYFVSSAHPRIVDGAPSKNPRYLQARADLVNPRETYLVEIAARLRSRIPPGQPLHTPVNAVLPGRRNNPPDLDAGIRALSVYNPIHYMELPELFMEFICSMTGKSPSTTGAGSEGALTKGPFNALPPIIDVNNALVAFLLCGHDGFVTAAGCVGPRVRVDHDISLLVPEVWCRMSLQEREPLALIQRGCLEKCEDFEHDGKKVLASRLGYRITRRFVNSYFGRIFNHPDVVFTNEMLQPELQDCAIFADAMENIVTTQKSVAQMYFNDGSIDSACPPLRALLHIMRDGDYEGRGLNHPDIRALFTRQNLLASDWYAARLKAKQTSGTKLWMNHVEHLKNFLNLASHADEAARLKIEDRHADAHRNLEFVKSAAYLEHLRGSIGAHPF